MSLLFVLFRRMTNETSGSGTQVLTELPRGLTETIQIVTEPGHTLPYGEAGRQKIEQAAAKDPEVAAAIELLQMITNTASKPLADIDWDGDIKVQLLRKLEDYAEVLVFSLEEKGHFARSYRAKLSKWKSEPGKDHFSQYTEGLEEKYSRLRQALERFPQLLKRYDKLLSEVQAMESDAV